MEPKYHIDGTQEFGYSTEKRCWHSFYLLMNTVKRVCEHYNNASVHDLNGYAAHFCYRRLVSFDTLIKVVLEHNDVLSANCLLRMLGDSVAVFHLIYMENDVDLRWLRHALYVIDGCEQNMKVLGDGEINRGTMPDEEFEVFSKRLEGNIKRRQRMMNEAQQIIDYSPLRNQDKEAFDKIIKDRNWKFKEFKSYKRKGENQYKWKELYEIIGRCEHFDLLSFISQYVHGLSMSNLVMDMNVENRDGVITEAFGLINKLNEDMLMFFGMDYPYIMEGLLDSKMREKLLACYDDEHRPTVEQWTEWVMNNINCFYRGN